MDRKDAMASSFDGGSAIRYYCVDHHVTSNDSSPVTVYQDAWAYCVHGCAGGHAWVPIEPVSYAELRTFGPRFIDRIELLVPA